MNFFGKFFFVNTAIRCFPAFEGFWALCGDNPALRLWTSVLGHRVDVSNFSISNFVFCIFVFSNFCIGTISLFPRIGVKKQTPLNAITDTFFRKEALPIEDCTENILTEIWTQRVPRFLVLPELYKWSTSSVIDSFSNWNISLRLQPLTIKLRDCVTSRCRIPDDLNHPKAWEKSLSVSM